MSILSAGGRSATARRFSQAALYGTNCSTQRLTSAARRRESTTPMGRRRELDLYDTKDIIFTHEQVKKAKQTIEGTRTNRTSR
jgi:hypothetical protein